MKKILISLSALILTLTLLTSAFSAAASAAQQTGSSIIQENEDPVQDTDEPETPEEPVEPTEPAEPEDTLPENEPERSSYSTRLSHFQARGLDLIINGLELPLGMAGLCIAFIGALPVLPLIELVAIPGGLGCVLLGAVIYLISPVLAIF